MKSILVLTVFAVISGCATTSRLEPTVELEFRPGSHTPGRGLKEMTVAGSSRKVYVSKKVALSNEDLVSARVIQGHMGPGIEIIFTARGAQKLATITGECINKPLGILVDGQLISAPVIRERIGWGRTVINARLSPQEAKRIAEGIAPR